MYEEIFVNNQIIAKPWKHEFGDQLQLNVDTLQSKTALKKHESSMSTSFHNIRRAGGEVPGMTTFTPAQPPSKAGGGLISVNLTNISNMPQNDLHTVSPIDHASGR